jgi:hypothetical protein
VIKQLVTKSIQWTEGIVWATEGSIAPKKIRLQVIDQSINIRQSGMQLDIPSGMSRGKASARERVVRH